jgi:hypothetical protein
LGLKKMPEGIFGFRFGGQFTKSSSHHIKQNSSVYFF